MVVIFIIRMQPADRRGQGVSDIIDAIYYREGRVRAVSALRQIAGRRHPERLPAARSGARRRSSRSARRSPRASRAYASRAMAAHDAGRRGRRGGARRRLQRAAGLDRLRDRADDAGDQPAHLAAGNDRGRRRHVRRPLLLRLAADLPGADRHRARSSGSPASSLCCRSCLRPAAGLRLVVHDLVAGLARAAVRAAIAAAPICATPSACCWSASWSTA